ncbi:MAG: PAC2 family protein [Chloroflexota bacterium]
MKSLVRFTARPKLNTPNMLASWPGVSNVSLNVATYLIKKLGFKKLAEIQAIHFFDPSGVLVRKSLIEAPQFPKSEFYYWKSRRAGSDIILFIGEEQPPPNKVYEMANLVLDVGIKYKMKRVYTCAAAITHMHHTEQPRVWGAVTSEPLALELKKYQLVQEGTLQIAGLNGLLLGIARERGIEGVCLLGEVPMYASRIPNPMAALAIIDVLSKLLEITVDTKELSEIAIEVKEKMKQAAAAAMGEYIDYFTEPIWEYGEENNEEEDEDEEE